MQLPCLMDTYQRLSLLWGVTSMYISEIDDAKRLVDASERLRINKKALKEEDLVVPVIGMVLKEGATNMIKIHRVGHAD